MLDDTCYFLPCRTLEQADPPGNDLLNGPVALGLIRALGFPTPSGRHQGPAPAGRPQGDPGPRGPGRPLARWVGDRLDRGRPASRPIDRPSPTRLIRGDPRDGLRHHQLLQPVAREGVLLQHHLPRRPEHPRPWSTFYLLHGLSDDHTIWQRRTSIERYVEGLPLVVVMPDGGRGWYTNAIEGYAHEDDLIKDVVGLVDRTFPVKAERAGRAIGGLSMGGYGAVKLGLKHHEMFGSINSHSGALGFLRSGPREQSRSSAPSSPGSSARPPPAGPKTPSPSSRRSTTAASRRCGSTAGPRTSCSSRTGPSTPTSKDEHPPRVSGVPGLGHDWAYWDLHVREAIAFHAKNLVS